MLLFMHWSRYREGGQGIVEYAMIMAFVLSIAISLHYGGLKNVIGDTFFNATSFFSTIH